MTRYFGVKCATCEEPIPLAQSAIFRTCIANHGFLYIFVRRSTNFAVLDFFAAMKTQELTCLQQGLWVQIQPPQPWAL
jgi:hypothetical protein